MSQCPNCQKQIDLQEKHFGALYTCPQCQAVYFINFDGQPEYDPNPPAYNPEDYQQNVSVPEEQTMELGAHSQISKSENSKKSHSSEVPSSMPAEEMERIVLDSLSENMEAPFEIPLEKNLERSAGELSYELPDENSETLNAPLSQSLNPLSVASRLGQSIKNPLQDVVDFANSNEASTAGIEYNLKISGIDSKDLLEAVKEALTDSRFMWDLDKILENIKDGELNINRISPVKASLLVSRLRFHDLEISWEQNAL